MSAPRALITGVAGQDGSYLAELLLERGYEVFGIVRGSPLARLSEPGRRAGRPAPAAGRPARPDDAARRDHARRARRAVQPRRDLVRAGVVAPAGHDGAVHRGGRDVDARGGPHHQAGPARLPGLDLGDVRRHHGVAAARAHALRAAQPIRGGEALRPPHGLDLPRALRHARQLGDPLQPRVAAPATGVRQPQGHADRGGDQARPRRPSCSSATSTRGATGASQATSPRRCG